MTTTEKVITVIALCCSVFILVVAALFNQRWEQRQAEEQVQETLLHHAKMIEELQAEIESLQSVAIEITLIDGTPWCVRAIGD